MLHAFSVAPLTGLNGLSEWLLKASPLILIDCGLAVGFRANVWNIGAGGQLVMEAIAATGVGLFWPVPGVLMLPAMGVAGAVAGMARAAIPAYLHARPDTNEILVSLMLTHVAGLILSWLVHGPWRDPAGFNCPQTALLPAAAMFEPFDPMYRLNPSILLTLTPPTKPMLDWAKGAGTFQVEGFEPVPRLQIVTIEEAMAPMAPAPSTRRCATAAPASAPRARRTAPPRARSTSESAPPIARKQGAARAAGQRPTAPRAGAAPPPCFGECPPAPFAAPP